MKYSLPTIIDGPAPGVSGGSVQIPEPAESAPSTNVVTIIPPRELAAEFIIWAYENLKRIASEDDQKRDVVAVQFPGHYGPAGIVVTVDGSPTRATLIVNPKSLFMVLIGNSNKLVRGDGYCTSSRPAGRRFREACEWAQRFGFELGSGATG